MGSNTTLYLPVRIPVVEVCSGIGDFVPVATSPVLISPVSKVSFSGQELNHLHRKKVPSPSFSK